MGLIFIGRTLLRTCRFSKLDQERGKGDTASDGRRVNGHSCNVIREVSNIYTCMLTVDSWVIDRSSHRPLSPIPTTTTTLRARLLSLSALSINLEPPNSQLSSKVHSLSPPNAHHHNHHTRACRSDHSSKGHSCSHSALTSIHPHAHLQPNPTFRSRKTKLSPSVA